MDRGNQERDKNDDGFWKGVVYGIAGGAAATFVAIVSVLQIFGGGGQTERKDK